MARCWRGQESGGISIALVAKHKRKDQLIDKILIRAFDSYDRSVKAAAAPSPSSTFTLLKLTCVSLYRLPSRSPSPPPFVSCHLKNAWKRHQNSAVLWRFDTSLKSQMHSGSIWRQRASEFYFNQEKFRHISAARRSSRLPPRPYASRTHTTRYLHHNTVCFLFFFFFSPLCSWLKW